MSDTDGETGQLLRENWYRSLNEISDLSLQRRMWLDPENTNPHWSYIEFVCTYPDDDQLQEAHERKWLSADETKILMNFGRILLNYKCPHGNTFDNEAILNDPAWHMIVRVAQAAAQELDAL